MSLNSALQNILNDTLSETSHYFDFPLGRNVFSTIESNTAFPPMNVVETANTMEATLEIPGVQLENINLELRNDNLVISCEKTLENRQESDKVHRYERRSGSFTRKFRVFPGTRNEDVRARYVNGVLTISINRNENPVRLPNRIPIVTV